MLLPTIAVFFQTSIFFLWALVKWSHTFLCNELMNNFSIWATLTLHNPFQIKNIFKGKLIATVVLFSSFLNSFHNIFSLKFYSFISGEFFVRIMHTKFILNYILTFIYKYMILFYKSDCVKKLIVNNLHSCQFNNQFNHF